MGENKLNNVKNIVFFLLGICVALFAFWGASALWGKRNALREERRALLEQESEPTIMPQPDAESGENNGAEETSKAVENADSVEIQEIAYPFGYGREEWKLFLYRTETGNGVDHAGSGYLLRMYDEKEEMIQEFSFDLEAEELVFRFDRLFQAAGSEKDLEIFPVGAEESGAAGLLFPWDYESDRFSEDPIAIPWYELYEQNTALNAYLVRDTEGDVETKRIYRINVDMRRPVELRRWTLTGQAGGETAGQLEVWDCLEQVPLYDGAVVWNEQGELANSKYYEGLFWRDLETFWDPWGAEEIPTMDVPWDGENENYNYMSYGSREELLTDFGFEGANPFYEYYDSRRNLVLELYFDEQKKEGCGIHHRYYHNSQLEKIVVSNGFAFHHVVSGDWNPQDTFSLLSVEGETADQSWVSGYREIYEYIDDGKLSFLEARGILEDYQEEPMEESLLSMDYYYRDDGTLSFRAYVHHPVLFGTWFQWKDSSYDDLGRLIYEKGYVTHGSFINFYIYEGNSDQPAYCLFLDDNTGSMIPEMIRYK